MYKQIMNCLLTLSDAGKSERGLKKLSPELRFMKESITNSKSAFLVFSTEIKNNIFYQPL